MIADWFEKKALLITGKGGVGKSLVSTLLAREAALSGKRVCLMQCSIEDQIGPLFGNAPIGHRMTQLMPGLDCINLDLDLNFRDFIVYQMGFERIFEQIFNQKLVRSFLGVIPGLRELALIGRVYHYAMLESQPYDLVIFDGFSSGHFLQLMTTPKAVFESEVVGTVLNVTKKVDDFFRNQQLCGTVVVTNPEFLPLSECMDLLRQLREKSPSAVCGVAFNRFPVEPTGEQATTLKSAPETLAFVRERARNASQMAAKARDEMRPIFAGQLLDIASCTDAGAIDEPLSPHTITALNLRDASVTE
jgi:anion-transporting  ArsA/GET3 family ATPase